MIGERHQQLLIEMTTGGLIVEQRIVGKSLHLEDPVDGVAGTSNCQATISRRLMGWTAR